MPLLLTVSCSRKSTLVLPFCYRLTRVVLNKGSLNGCCCCCKWLILPQQLSYWSSMIDRLKYFSRSQPQFQNKWRKEIKAEPANACSSVKRSLKWISIQETVLVCWSCHLFGGSGETVTATGRHKSMVLVSAVTLMFGKHRVDGHRLTTLRCTWQGSENRSYNTAVLYNHHRHQSRISIISRIHKLVGEKWRSVKKILSM